MLPVTLGKTLSLFQLRRIFHPDDVKFQVSNGPHCKPELVATLCHMEPFLPSDKLTSYTITYWGGPGSFHGPLRSSCPASS